MRRDSIEHASAAAICLRGDDAFSHGCPTAEGGCSVALPAPARLPRPGIDAVEHIARLPACTAFTSITTLTTQIDRNSEVHQPSRSGHLDTTSVVHQLDSIAGM